MNNSISISICNNVNRAERIPSNEVPIFIFYGQSESVGSQSGSVDNSFSVNANAKTLQGFPRTHIDQLPANINWTIDTRLLTTSAEPIEQINGSYAQTAVRAFLSKVANELTQDTYSETLGKGAFTIEALSVNTSDFYNICAVIQAIGKVTGLKPHPLLFFYHGAANANTGTSKATYKTLVKQLRRDLDYQVKRIRRDDFITQLYLAQFTAFNYVLGSKVAEIALAQLELSYEDDNITLLEPTYFLTFADYVHPDAAGQNEIGYALGQGWIDRSEGLTPQSISTNGTDTITIKTNGTLSTTTIVDPLPNHGINIDSGTITNVTLSGSDIIVTYTGSPTKVNCAWDLTSNAPHKSNSDIVNSKGAHIVAFELSTTWTKPAVVPDVPVAYTHTNTTDEDIFAEDCHTWFIADVEQVSGTTIKCKAKSGCDWIEQTGSIPTRVTINGASYYQFDSAKWFESTVDAAPLGDFTIIIVGNHTVLQSVTKKYMSWLKGANEPYFGTYDDRWMMSSPTSGVSWKTGDISANTPHILIASYNATTGNWTRQLNNNASQTVAGAVTTASNAIYQTIMRIGGDGRYTPPTALLDSNVSIAHVSVHNGDLFTNGRLADKLTYLNSKYTIY